MKPNYKNWVPKGMVVSVLTVTVLLGIFLLIAIFSNMFSGNTKDTVIIVSSIIFVIMFVYSLLCVNWYVSFSYNGKKQISRKIITAIAEYVVIPENGTGLDVGCGSGALTIACAKRNPRASMVGLDRWGKEYASFNKALCENNAKIEGVGANTSFVQGDAVKLDYPDESFDAVTSNYCYHNIPSKNRQAIILETLRVLKKGGTFAIHDEFIKGKYGDMQKLLDKLKDMNYEKAELIDTTSGLFLDSRQATVLCLKGSALLVGKK